MARNIFHLCAVALSLMLVACGAKEDAPQPKETTQAETQKPTAVARSKNALGFDETLSLRENLEGAKKLRFMTEAMQLAHPSGQVGAEYSNITVFAPNTQAFRAISRDRVAQLQSPESRDQVYNLVAAHIVQGQLSRGDILAGIQQGDGTFYLPTIRGTNIKFTRRGRDIIVSNDGAPRAKIITPDARASDGYVHLIDTLLEPK